VVKPSPLHQWHVLELMRIVNDDSRVVNKPEASLIDDTRVVIYDRHMFIVQATDVQLCEYIMRSP
jgi:hypothetical protein